MFFDWKDWKTWAPLLPVADGRRRDVGPIVAAFERNYTGVIAYHGCRPEDVAPYYERGVQVADHRIINQLARDVLLSGKFQHVTPRAVELAISRVSNMDDGQCFLCLDDREFIERSGHYLIYGSERMLAITAQLGQHQQDNWKAMAKERGRPTIIRCELPMNFLKASLRRCLAGYIRENIVRVRKRLAPLQISTSVILNRGVPATCVVSHWHPTRIVDPHDQMCEYFYEG